MARCRRTSLRSEFGCAPDAGDDLVYLTVGLKMDNTVVAQAPCYKGSQTDCGRRTAPTGYLSAGGRKRV